MKKLLSAMAAVLSFAFGLLASGCSNELDDSKNLLLALKSNQSQVQTGSFVFMNEESRGVSVSELKAAKVVVAGFGADGAKFERESAVVSLAAGKADSIVVENIPVSENVVVTVKGYYDAAGSKAVTGQVIRCVTDIATGQNTAAVNWETSVKGYIFNALHEAGVNVKKSDDISALSSIIDAMQGDGTKACMVEAAAIAADYKAGSLKSADKYVKSFGTVSAKVYGYAGKTLKIADPCSGAVTAPADGGSVTFENVCPGVWDLYAGADKIQSLTVVSGANSITIGSDPSKVVIFVKTTGNKIYAWGDTSEKKYAGPWSGSALNDVTSGMMNNPEGWKYYDISSVYDKDSINFILLNGETKLTDDVMSGKSATFWYDGSKFYDADPTTPVLPDDNTNLKDIKVNGSSIGAVASYEVAYKVSSVTVTAEAESAKASVTVSPAAETALTAGVSKAFTITVTAEDGSSRNYTLNVKRLAKVEGDVTLESVSVNGTSIGALAGNSFTKALKGGDDSMNVTVTAVANDSESASVTVTPSTGSIADGVSKTFTIKVTNGGKSAAYTLTVSYTKQAGSKYYWTNKNGFGSNKTISSWSDWTAAEQIAQCAAYDDPRSWRGVQEVNYDVYALYAAYDDTNLYIMAELVNPVDRMTDGVGFMWHDYPSSDNAWWNNRDIPLGLALNTGKALKPANGPFLDSSSVIWGGPNGGVKFTDSEGMDWILYHSSKYGTFAGDGTFVGVGTPGFFHVNDEGYFSYDEEYCLNVNRGSVAGNSGVDIKYKRNCAVSKKLYFESTPKDNRSTSEQTGETLMASEEYTEIPTSDFDMSYWYTIPLSTLGINKAYIESHGIGIRQLTTGGGSLMDCAPWDPCMVDVAGEECEDDVSTSAEKRDVDNITTPQARIGR